MLRATPEGLAQATGADDQTLQMRLVREVLDALWVHEDSDADERSAQLEAAYALMREIEPRDAAEGMLAAQMVAVHGAAMDCLRRAMHPGQTEALRDAAMRQATKLLTLFPRQLETLDRRRGKGSVHTIRVEHVTRAEERAGDA